jgi:hypothetical protein
MIDPPALFDAPPRPVRGHIWPGFTLYMVTIIEIYSVKPDLHWRPGRDYVSNHNCALPVQVVIICLSLKQKQVSQF